MKATMTKIKQRLRLVLTICTALISLYNLEVSFVTSGLNQLRFFSMITGTGTTERQSPLQEVIPNGNGSSSWENDHNLVHIILTRFMQHQPDLLHLGRARLELFKSFCLPTMLQQTNKQFLWIIRVDPVLHPHLKEEFLQTLVSNTNQINVVVVGSNARVDDGHFRHPNAIADINASTVWLGNPDLVYSYHQAAQNHTVLETGLDADDGLSLSFVQDLQTQTALLAQRQENLRMAQQNQSKTATNATSRSSWWKLWCVNASAEWHFYSHYMNSSYGHMSESGSTTYTSINNQNKVEEKPICITPGLTRVSTSDYQVWKESNGTKQEGGQFPDLQKWGHRFFIDHFFIQQNARNVQANQVGGWSYFPANYVPAIRARTPTSAGMKGVVRTNVTSRTWTMQEQNTWLQIVKWFGLSMDQIQQSRSAIHNNLKLVLDDALRGQCSEGHSCQERAATMLEYLKNKEGGRA